VNADGITGVLKKREEFRRNKRNIEEIRGMPKEKEKC
jgi:hypothetical protein